MAGNTESVLDKDVTIPSQFKIGDEAFFRPGISMGIDTAFKVRIVAVSFTSFKVLYDIELQVKNGDEVMFYSVWPVRSVDSYFITK